MTNIRHISCNDATLIPSSDGVTIAFHDLGGEGSPMLLSHATGFHGHCWEAFAASVANSHHSYAHDHRGYGDSDQVDPAALTWTSFGDDALAAARHASSLHGGAPVVGVGHSKGGASLLMAALKQPELFTALFVFEPIVFPPPDPSAETRQNPLASGARKRRAHFASYEEALENFSSKPPMATFDPVAREAYVRHGFKPSADGGVELKCAPEHEARTYETGSSSGAWDTLPDIRTKVWVISGAPAPFQPSSFAIKVAERIPNATYVQWDEMGHFGPLEHPQTFAGFVTRALSTM